MNRRERRLAARADRALVSPVMFIAGPGPPRIHVLGVPHRWEPIPEAWFLGAIARLVEDRADGDPDVHRQAYHITPAVRTVATRPAHGAYKLTLAVQMPDHRVFWYWGPGGKIDGWAVSPTINSREALAALMLRPEVTRAQAHKTPGMVDYTHTPGWAGEDA